MFPKVRLICLLWIVCCLVGGVRGELSRSNRGEECGKQQGLCNISPVNMKHLKKACFYLKRKKIIKIIFKRKRDYSIQKLCIVWTRSSQLNCIPIVDVNV